MHTVEWTNGTDRQDANHLLPCCISRSRRGSAVAKIVGGNVQKFDHFQDEVKMWVFEEQVDGQNLTEIINAKHENVK